MAVPEEVSFNSGGVRCAAEMYWPDPVDGNVPFVVMGVLAFDYRHFGASDNQPRQAIDVAERQDDYRAAVRFARS
jgi:uncharacterized protein